MITVPLSFFVGTSILGVSFALLLSYGLWLLQMPAEISKVFNVKSVL